MVIIIFVSVVLIVYSLTHFYIYKRGIQALPEEGKSRKIFRILFSIVAPSFILYYILILTQPSAFSDFVGMIGALWLAAVLYIFLFLVLFDLLRLLNKIFKIFPAFIKTNYAKVKLYLMALTALTSCLAIILGYINAANPVVNEMNLKIEKSANGLKKLRIVMLSDIHMGHIIGQEKVGEMVDTINSLNPDIVLFAGDIIDGEIEPVLRNNVGEPLKNLKSKYGTWAITGNHEYIGGIEEAVPYLRSLGIHLLIDSSALIDNSFYIVGRKDRAVKQFNKGERLPLEEILPDNPQKLPVILMDHQPFALSETAKKNIDLQLSGHTHHGQLWPLNYITESVYELSWGYKKINGAHFYVSSGYGTWGPPVRTGNTPEIVVLKLEFL